MVWPILAEINSLLGGAGTAGTGAAGTGAVGGSWLSSLLGSGGSSIPFTGAENDILKNLDLSGIEGKMNSNAGSHRGGSLLMDVTEPYDGPPEGASFMERLFGAEGGGVGGMSSQIPSAEMPEDGLSRLIAMINSQQAPRNTRTQFEYSPHPFIRSLLGD